VPLVTGMALAYQDFLRQASSKPVGQLGTVADSEAPSQQREQVRSAFKRLRQLRNGLSLDCSLKTIAREGLA